MIQKSSFKLAVALSLAGPLALLLGQFAESSLVGIHHLFLVLVVLMCPLAAAICAIKSLQGRWFIFILISNAAFYLIYILSIVYS